MKTTTEILMIDVPTARMYLEDYAFEGQRKHDESWSLHLSNQMKEGKFAQDTTIDVASLEVSNTEHHYYLVGGQHRLQAILLCGLPQQFVVVFHAVTTMAEVAELYYRNDIGKRRTVKDMFTASGLSEELCLTKSDLTFFAGAVKILDKNFLSKSMSKWSPDDIRNLLIEWRRECQQFYKVTYGGESTVIHKLRNGGVLSVALMTFRVYPEKAVHFWHAVACNSGLIDGQPERTLVKYLMKYYARKSSELDTIRRVAQCWNAYVEGKRIEQTKPSDLDKPVVIKGKPIEVQEEELIREALKGGGK
jgi:hypothetical protein